MSVEEKVKEIIATIFQIERGKITSDTHLVKDLHIKSINLVEMIAWMEEEFNIQINLAEARRKNTVGEVIEYIKTLITCKKDPFE